MNSTYCTFSLSELVEGHVDEVRAGYRSESIEGREKFVMSRRHGGRRQKITHRECIDQAVIELLIAHGFGERPHSRAVASRLRQRYVV
jgi:hypothetical protein